MDFINSAIKANQELSRLISGAPQDEWFKEHTVGAGGDKSLGMDLISEKIFIKHLASYGQIVSEECGIYGEGKDRIVLDPLDGSNNFMSQMPYFGTSVSLERDGRVICAVIVNLSNLDIFIKSDSFLKHAKLDKLDFKEVKQNPFATIGVFERSYSSDLYVKKLKEAKIKYRSPGALALSLAYASNLEFVMYEGKVREYDVSAGFYMCEDMSIHKGEDFFLICKEEKTFQELKDILEIRV